MPKSTLGSASNYKNKKSLMEFLAIDPVLLMIIISLALVGLMVLYSASLPSLYYFEKQQIHFVIAFVIMLTVSQFSIETIKTLGIAGFIVSIIALILVPIIGVSHKGAQRWISLGFMEFQPSELAKLTLPMIMSLFLSSSVFPIKLGSYLLSFVLLLIPVLLIASQPDLGTSILIASSGLLIIFFSGVSWKIIGSSFLLLAGFLPIFWNFLIKDYQRTRILTVLDSEKDPLGSGYHIIQSKIAIGSGGMSGKGWQEGSQSRLEFLPERHTDFIFSVLAEEFGFLGVLLLFTLILLLVFRGLWISTQTKDIYARLLAGSISMTFFFYCFINIGMVSGILPVVGLPLPLLSYGGTTLITIFIGFGILMAIHRDSCKK